MCNIDDNNCKRIYEKETNIVNKQDDLRKRFLSGQDLLQGTHIT